jgi:hypothetical protein
MNVIRNNFVVYVTLRPPANIYPVGTEIIGVIIGLFVFIVNYSYFHRIWYAVRVEACFYF